MQATPKARSRDTTTPRDALGDGAGSTRGLSLDGLRAWLRAWALWRHQAHAWGDCCVLGRERDARRAGAPGSRLPAGVHVPREVQAVMEAMQLAEGIGGQVWCNVGVVQACYLAGCADYATLARALGCDERRLRERRAAGEMWLHGRLAQVAA